MSSKFECAEAIKRVLTSKKSVSEITLAKILVSVYHGRLAASSEMIAHEDGVVCSWSIVRIRVRQTYAKAKG